MQRCSKCGEEKGPAEFYPRRRTCKACILSAAKARYQTDVTFRDRLRRQALERSQRVYGHRLPRSCSRCGKDMLRNATGQPGVCQRCKRLAGYKINVTKAERRAIYERDAWTCQFCGCGVVSDLHPNDPFAATLDHIVPRSTGGTDDLSNLRLVHRWCNSIRKDSPALTLEELAA